MNYKEVLNKIIPNIENVKSNFEEIDNIEKELKKIQENIEAYNALDGMENEVSRANNREAHLNNQKEKLYNKSVCEMQSAQKVIKEVKRTYTKKIDAYTRAMKHRENTINMLKERMITLKQDGNIKKYKATNEYVKKVIEEKKAIARKRTEVFESFREEKDKYDRLEKLLVPDNIRTNIKLLENEIAKPEKAEPVRPEPAKAEPVKAEPVKVEPAKAEPVKTEPVKTEPVKAEPVKSEPVKTEPVKTEPVKSEPIKSEPVKSEPVKAEPIKSEPVKTEPVKAEPIKSEPVKTEQVKSEPVKTEPVKAEPVKAEPVKTEPVKAEPVKAEPVKAEPVKTEPVKAEPVKTEPVRQIIKPKPVKTGPVREIIKPEKKSDIIFEDIYSGAKNISDYVIKDDEDQIEDNGIDGILVSLTKEGFVTAYAFDKSFENEEVDYEEAVKSRRISYNSISEDKGLDLNIADLLYDLSQENKIGYDIYEAYVDGILENAEMPFWITYDLTDIYKSDLTDKEIKNLFKISKQAKKINPDIVVKKDNILKRTLGRIGRMVNPVIDKVKSLIPSKKQEMLKEGNDEMNNNNNVTDKKQEKSFIDAYSQGLQYVGRVISDSKTIDELKMVVEYYKDFIKELNEKEGKYINNIIGNTKRRFRREEQDRVNTQRPKDIPGIVVEDVEVSDYKPVKTDSIKETEEKYGITVEDVEL